MEGPNGPHTHADNLVGGSSGEWGGGETDTVVGGIKDGVEALQESETVDEVETFTAGRAKVVDDEVDVTGDTADEGVEAAGPCLGVGGKAEGNAVNVEVQRLEGGELSGGQAQQASGFVKDSTGSLLVCIKGIGGKKNEGGSGIDDTDSGGKNVGSAKLNALADTPEFAGRGGSSNGGECDGSGELGRISSAKGQVSFSTGTFIVRRRLF
jgi:hypothetical protein